MQETEDAEVCDKKKQRSAVWRQFLIYCLGIVFAYSGFGAIFMLQSSLNIEEGLGTTTIGVSYGFSIVVGLMITPYLIRRLGAKKCIVASEVGYLIYVAANFYPEYYTLLPGGLAVSFAEATVWPCMSMVNVYFATKYHKFDKKSLTYNISLFSGYFFLSYQITMITGNLLSYAFLKIFDLPPPSNSTLLNSTCQNSTHCALVNDFSSCGQFDCQDDSVIDRTMEQYRPVNEVALYMLITVLSLFLVIAIILHGVFMPDIGCYLDDFTNAGIQKAASIEFLTGTKKSSESPEKLPKPVTTIEGCSEEVALFENDEENFASNHVKSMEMSPCRLISETMRSLWTQVKIPEQLLLIPLNLYNGLAMGFVFGELTRAYSSCVIGVEWVGVCMAIYGVGDCIMSAFVGKYARKTGRLKLYIVVFVIEVASYAYCLLWNPSLETSWSIFIVYFSFGFGDGILQTILNVTYIDYFPNNQDVALTLWNLFITIGIGSMFLLSKLLCMTTKIYFNFSVLVVGLIGAIAVSYIRRKSKRVPSAIEENTNL